MCGDILNARTTAEEHTHKRTEYFTVLITDRLRKPNVESITLDKRASKCSMIENIPPKGVIESNFICTLAMSDEDLFDFYMQHKVK